ncbi:MAG: hypothetical protein N2508_00800 [Anaerolineae bacterium]|nr:hypothetical protein [Anaerolineae bacterium]
MGDGIAVAHPERLNVFSMGVRAANAGERAYPEFLPGRRRPPGEAERLQHGRPGRQRWGTGLP